ncbi:hypothetical protein FQZ97_1056090 [compost metagenome]
MYVWDEIVGSKVLTAISSFEKLTRVACPLVVVHLRWNRLEVPKHIDSFLVGLILPIKLKRKNMVNLRLAVVEHVASTRHEHLGGQPGLAEQLALIKLTGSVLLNGNLPDCI